MSRLTWSRREIVSPVVSALPAPFQSAAAMVNEIGRGVIDFRALHRISPLESARVQPEYIDKVLAPIYA